MMEPDYAKQAMSEIILSLTSNIIDLRTKLLAAEATIAGLTAPKPAAPSEDGSAT
jgi:hypothetical protein